jgi:hypothetical protein
LSAKVAGVDLDLAQALFKRISRLERALGEQLFVRAPAAWNSATPGGVSSRTRVSSWPRLRAHPAGP